MKLIIDISEGIYKHIDTIQNGSIGAKQIINSVKNGIPAYKAIPSAEPKTGYWIKQVLPVKPFGEDTVLCDQCAFITDKDSQYNYCPNCGCRMVEPQESEGV